MRERGKVFHTMRSERGHASERRDLNSGQGPAKAFHHHARRALLSEVAIRHKELGGVGLVGSGGQRRQLAASPLPPMAPDPFVGLLPQPALSALNDPLQPAKSIMDIVGASLVSSRALAAPSAAVGAVAPVPKAASSAAVAPPDSGGRTGVGGGIFITVLNSKRAAFKQTVGGRKLTAAELEETKLAAQEEWAAAKREGGRRLQLWRELFDAERQQRKTGGPQGCQTVVASAERGGGGALRSYSPLWGRLGTPSHPVQPELVVQHVQSHGMPTDENVYRSSANATYQTEVVHPLRGPPSPPTEQCNNKSMKHLFV